MTRRVLLTGGTGFVGRDVHDRLRAAGWAVRCLSRHPDAARSQWPGREWIGGDVGDAPSLGPALRDCQAALYLVHGMADLRPGWDERDVRAAETFARAAAQAGLERIVYLGGVAPAGPPSRHLRSRLRTGEALRVGPVPCLELRASMIVGAGGASWAIVRDLAARLPAMVLPAWLRSRTEPVALEDVSAALVGGLRLELGGSDWWDLPGPEVLSGKEILLRVAAVLGRRPWLLQVPLVSPGLSSHWIRLVTRADHALARELVEGLRSDLLAQRPGFWARAGLDPPIALEVATRRALAAEGRLAPRQQLLEGLAGLVTRRA